MSASISLHGPFKASANLVGPGQWSNEPFVSFHILAGDVDAGLIHVTAADLDSLESAIADARKVMPS